MYLNNKYVYDILIIFAKDFGRCFDFMCIFAMFKS